MRLTVLTLALYTLSASAQDRALTATEILKQAFDNEVEQEALRSRYFYRENARRYQAKPDEKPGKLSFTRDFEWVYLEGQPFRKLVAMDNKPLKGQAALEVQKQMRMTAAERKTAGSKPKPNQIRAGEVELPAILGGMTHTLLREERMNGRAAWVIQCDPATIPPPGDSYRFTFWVDGEDFAIAQKKFEVIRMGAEALPGSWSVSTMRRVSGALWFVESNEGYYISAPPKPLQKWVQKHRFFDFKKFDAETTVTFGPPEG